jgi:hypothetical protein
LDKETGFLKKINEKQREAHQCVAELDVVTSEHSELRVQHATLRASYDALLNVTKALQESTQEGTGESTGAGSTTVELPIGAEKGPQAEIPALRDEVEAVATAQVAAEKVVSSHEQKVAEALAAGANSLSKESAPVGDALVILATFNNSDALAQCIDSVLRDVSGSSKYPIFVSQYGDEPDITALISRERYKKLGIRHLRFVPSEMEPEGGEAYPVSFQKDFAGTQHLKWVLSQLFDVLSYDKAIIVDENLVVHAGFFDYFSATSNLFEDDPETYIVSAYNPNGHLPFSLDAKQVYRSDYLSGEAFMLARDTWDELGSQWPATHWLDWLADPAQRKNRTIVFPEASRVTLLENSIEGENATDISELAAETESAPLRLVRADTAHLVTAKYDAWVAEKMEKATTLKSPELVTETLANTPKVAENANLTTAETVLALGYSSSSELTAWVVQIGLASTRRKSVLPGFYKGTLIYRPAPSVIVLLFSLPPPSLLANASTTTTTTSPTASPVTDDPTSFSARLVANIKLNEDALEKAPIADEIDHQERNLVVEKSMQASRKPMQDPPPLTELLI